MKLLDRLYGRTREIAVLLELHSATVTLENDAAKIETSENKRRTLVLVRGVSGVGKRALALSLLPHVRESQGLLLCVSCQDAGRQTSVQSTRDGAENPLDAICRTLCRMFDSDIDPLTQEALKDVFLSDFSDQADVEALTELLGSAGPWLRKHNLADRNNRATRTKSKRESKALRLRLSIQRQSVVNDRSILMLVRFVNAILSRLPLVLLVEHVKSADPAVVSFFECLLEHKDTRKCKGLLIIATHRDETGEMMKLPERLEAFLKSRGDDSETQLHLGNLSWDNLYQWAVDIFGSESYGEEMIKSMVDMVHDKSCGNPQFARYIFGYMMLKSTTKSLEKGRLDRWRDSISDNIDQMFVRVLQNQSNSVRRVVELVAALGACNTSDAGFHSPCCAIDCHFLEMVLQRSYLGDINCAQNYGLLTVTLSPPATLCFPCLDFQSAAYAMIPESQCTALHLKIGRRLWKNALLGSLEAKEGETAMLCVVANNLQRGLDRVTELSEMTIIASICMQVGKLAMKSSDFAKAARYFESAIAALRDRLWEPECFDLSLALHNFGGEAYYCIADFDRMERMLDAVFHHAESFQDKLQAYTTLVFANGTRNRLEEARRLAFKVLDELGEPIPANPGKFTVLSEYVKTRLLVRGKTDRFFLGLPDATDTNKVAAMQMLNFTMVYCYIIKPEWGALAIFRTIQLACRHGIAPPAVPAFAAFGFLLCVHFGRIQEGGRFGRIALALLEQSDGDEWLPRIHFFVHGLLNRWVRPLRESLESLRLAKCLALKSGDNEGGVLNASAFLRTAFHSGEPLYAVEQEARTSCVTMDSLGQNQGLVHLVPFWSSVCDLMGNTRVPLALSGDIANADDAENHAIVEGNRSAMRWMFVFQTVVCNHTGKHQRALAMAKLSWEAQADADMWLTFYEGLSSFSVARDGKGDARIGRKAVKQMKKWKWARCANIENKAALLEAEHAAARGLSTKAMTLFNLSIVLAQREGFVHEEGLAYERFGQYYQFLGRFDAAAPFFEKARIAYQRWGAQKLVTRMENAIASLGEPSAPLH
jgi:predicted ATPase